jgi:CubicO group peptidase (beta-lactamase class C family)
MADERLPLFARGEHSANSTNGSGDHLVEEQLSSYYKRQRERREQEQRVGRARSVFRASLGLLLASVLTLALLALGWAATRRNGASASPARLGGIVTAAKRFWGVARVSHNGHKKFERAVGWASVEFDAEMATDSVFPIGSNSKLFVAVALYQLQEAGKVDLTAPVNAYLDQRDFASFGFPNQTIWCPRVLGDTSGECQDITFVQLLSMASGIGDQVNCDNVEAQYCRQSADDLALYRGSIAAHVADFINDPLVFVPGTSYSYANPNFVLLAYMVEKLSGLQFEAYLKERIFVPVGLNNTYYDPFDGQTQLHKGWVEHYAHYYYRDDSGNATDASDSASGSSDDQDDGSVPSNVTSRIRLASTGTCRPYMSSGAASGAGGVHSTAKDMHVWYIDLFHKRGAKSKVLSQQSIQQILQRRNSVNPGYAQGVHVRYNTTLDAEWPAEISYCGGMKCAITCISMATPSANESSIASAFTNNVHLTFPSHEALAAFQPVGMLSVTGGGDFVADDGDATKLSHDLLDGYIQYRATIRP